MLRERQFFDKNIKTDYLTIKVSFGVTLLLVTILLVKNKCQNACVEYINVLPLYR